MPYFISEVAQAHDGSMLMAHSMIEASKKHGFNAIKFQAHFAEHESSKEEKFRIKLPYLPDKTRYDYWKRMELDYYKLNELYKHSKSLELDFICSPFSEFAVDLLEKSGVDVYKIGSGEFFNKRLIELVLQTKKKIYISTGMSSWDEIDTLACFIKDKYPNQYSNVVFFNCTTSYPCPIDKIGIKNISKLKKLLNTQNIGFSDHSGNPNTIIAGYFQGANFFEFHTVFSREIIGFDSSSSLTFNESFKLIEDIKYFDLLNSKSLDKNAISDSLGELKSNFCKSLYFSNDLVNGTIITIDHLVLKKPGIGISFDEVDTILGKQLKNDVKKDSLVNRIDLM